VQACYRPAEFCDLTANAQTSQKRQTGGSCIAIRRHAFAGSPGPAARTHVRQRVGSCRRHAVGSVDIALKRQFFNPLGSIKDRVGLAMVEAAELAGEIAPGKTTIVEPTSGNTGIALAFVAAAKGYKLIVVMPEGTSVEQRKLLRLLGPQVEATPAKLGMPGAIARAEGAWIARQFDNPANPAVHQATTAEEIWADTGGTIDFVVGGVGTGGTLTGIARGLKPRRLGLRAPISRWVSSASGAANTRSTSPSSMMRP
jgi:cysteine synthase